MTRCFHCQQPLYGRFCSHCGAPAVKPASASDNSNLIHGVIYLIGLWSLLFLFLEPYKRQETIRFHVFQNLLFMPLTFILGIPLFVSVVLAPDQLKIVFGILFGFLILVVALAHLWAIVAAFIGKGTRLPILADYADKLAAGNILR